MTNCKEIKEYVKENSAALLELLRSLCRIPAPSHHEEKRAAFLREYLENCGAKGVYIDSAKNVILPINCEGKSTITVFAAHTDTVFPDTEPYPMREDEEKIYCPGAGDDTASVAVLIFTAKYLIENNIKPESGVLIVLNSCEEGLGNLHGTRQLFLDYKDRISRFVSFDSVLSCIHVGCVGSHRYEVEALTEGGHSFSKFGKKNAICVLAEIISEIYKITVPEKQGTITTYNVGTIEGGTSVNTIAQNAHMLCEYRSDDMECLEIMKGKFLDIFSRAQGSEVTVNVKLIGDRPCCGNVDHAKQNALVRELKDTLTEVTGKTISGNSASTDCNIPLSLGIPAACIGVYEGAGAHTREEYVIKSSLNTGLEAAIASVLKLLTH